MGATDYEHLELEGDEAGTFFFNDSFEARIEAVQARRGRSGGSFGFQYFDRDLEAIGAEAFLPPTTTERWAAFALQEVESGPVRWQFGARFETQDITPASASGISPVSHEGFSGSLGLVWDATDIVSIAASVARSVKLPAAEELFSDGPHVATQAFEIGDPTLDEETGIGLDVSLRWESDHHEGEVTVFRQDFSDFIFQAFTGEIEDGFPVVVYSQNDAEFVGVELKSRIEIWAQDQHHVHLRLVGDLVDAELDSGENLPRIPPLRLGAGLHYHSEVWNASLESFWVDDQDDVSTNETPTDGYTMVHASLGYRFLLRNQIIDLLLRGRNLTDEEARTHTSFLKDVAPLPGRDISLAIKFQF
ncbi:MAG: TonB-dependent receptor [Thermoanaerobaculia bacterium]|nr:TonB-dependent receptor [Thermoanaerobaculia bacterium]